MSLTILFDEYTIPDNGVVSLHVDRSFEIHVTAEQARRQVKGWLIDQVSYMLTAQTPALVIGKDVVWRVPVVLTSAQVGHVGTVGEIDVNVATGAMDASPIYKERILVQARKLTTILPPYQPATSTPHEWLAKDLGSIPTVGRPLGNPLELIRADD